MIEYIYDAIKAAPGSAVTVSAKISDNEGNPITEGISFFLHDKEEKVIAEIEGEYFEDTWFFTIPAKVTEGLRGRYWYCIRKGEEHLCFMKPFYL